LSWKNYFLTPDEIWPDDIVLKASYTIQANQYICDAHVVLDPTFNFAELSIFYSNPYHYLHRELAIACPVFDGLSFGFSTEQSIHSYKSGAGSVQSSSIVWESSYYLINTQKHNFIFGQLSDYKSFVKSNGSAGAYGGSFDNTTYYDLFFNTYRPSPNWFKTISNEKGSLSINFQGSKPGWLDPAAPPPPPPPPTGTSTYPVHLLKASDDASNPLVLSDSYVTGSEISSKGYGYDTGKAYVIY